MQLGLRHPHERFTFSRRQDALPANSLHGPLHGVQIHAKLIRVENRARLDSFWLNRIGAFTGEGMITELRWVKKPWGGRDGRHEYSAPQGHYADDINYFASSGVENSTLHALSNALAGGNSVYLYGSGGVFPTNTFMSANYWVDVVFTTTLP